MSKTLTQWWQALDDDLEKLKTNFSNFNFPTTESWKAAKEMAKEGLLIENYVASWSMAKAQNCGSNIENASKKLGELGLPDVNNTENLLFAITYYQHLNRSTEIQSNITLVQAGIPKTKLQKAANELKQRIDTFLQENQDAVSAKYFKEVKYPGASLFEQLTSMLAGKDPLVEVSNDNSESIVLEVVQSDPEAEILLEKKLTKQIETDLAKPVPIHVNNYISNFFNLKNEELERKQKILWEIVNCKKLLQEMNSHTVNHLINAVRLQYKTEYDNVKLNFVDFAEDGRAKKIAQETKKVEAELAQHHYDVIQFCVDNENLNEDSEAKKYGVSLARGVMSSLKTSTQVGAAITQHAAEWVKMPQVVNELASQLANTAGAVIDAYTPESYSERKQALENRKTELDKKGAELQIKQKELEERKNQLIEQRIKELVTAVINKVISSLADELNSQENQDDKITGKDFVKMDSEQVTKLIDKLVLVGKIVNLKGTLVLCQEKQNKGIANVINVDVLGQIVKGLSKTSFKKFIYPSILLTLEEKNLQNQLDKLIKELEEHHDFDKKSVDNELGKALTHIEERSQNIKKHNIYGHMYFKKLANKKETTAEELSKIVNLNLSK